MRYFGRVAFNGFNYAGWQSQPNGKTVQQQIEDGLSILLRSDVKIVGCGRTDAGVHASRFYFHFDSDEIENLHHFLRSINGILHDDISFLELLPVCTEAHARYDAELRTYRYYLSGKNDPFRPESLFHYKLLFKTELKKVRETAECIASYDEFFPFTKTNTQTSHYLCNVESVKWIELSDNYWVFEISANRFLRGMVRLIVGSCLQVGTGKLDLSDIESACQYQKRLEHAWSVPGHGLYLTDIRYPYIKSVEDSYFFEPFGPLSGHI